MSFTSKNPKFDSTILKDQGVSSVPNPAAGSNKIVNRSGILYLRNSSGSEAAVGGVSITSDVSSNNTTINAGSTLWYPNLTIDTGTTYTIAGRLVSENILTVTGDLVVSGYVRVL